MIARVKMDSNHIYDTIVFGIIHNGWESKIIGFNKTLDNLELINCWNLHPEKRTIKRKVYIIDVDQNNWLGKDEYIGYDFIITNKNLLNQIKNNEKIDLDILNKCKNMQLNMKCKEWNTIESYDDVGSLMSVALGFHDSVVNNIQEYGNIVEVRFDTNWGCYIIIRFENDVKYKCKNGYGGDGEIFSASILLENGYIYWVDCEVDSSKHINDNTCYFKSKKASWKIEIY